MKKKNEQEEEILENSKNSEILSDNQLDNEDTSCKENDNMTDLETKYNELNDSYLRLNAEFDNYRKRTQREKADLLKSGNERVLLDIITVVDDFERALENIENTDDLDAVKEGINLIYNKFINFLSKNGVKEIKTEGESFDTDKHEALTTIPAEREEDKDKIVDCVQKGYTLNDKVIRYPKVIVAK